jgi:hypothetical protein
MSLVKSKHRLADHGEVFTPAWMVEAMLNLVTKHPFLRTDPADVRPATIDITRHCQEQ